MKRCISSGLRHAIGGNRYSKEPETNQYNRFIVCQAQNFQLISDSIQRGIVSAYELIMALLIFIYTDKQPGQCSTCPCALCLVMALLFQSKALRLRKSICLIAKDIFHMNEYALGMFFLASGLFHGKTLGKN